MEEADYVDIRQAIKLHWHELFESWNNDGNNFIFKHDVDSVKIAYEHAASLMELPLDHALSALETSFNNSSVHVAFVFDHVSQCLRRCQFIYYVEYERFNKMFPRVRVR